MIFKIGFLINWPREIDMYYPIIKELSINTYEVIVNDIKTIEPGRNNQHIIIQNILKNKKIKFVLFSRIYKKKKFKVLISTGEASSQKITSYSILKFIYAHTLGVFLEITKISKLCFFFFNKPLTAGGLLCKIGLNWYPERYIGNFILKFSDGMDLKTKHYPYNEYKDHFDVYLTQGTFESAIIKKKFKDKKTFIIGCLNLTNLRNKEKIYYSLFKEFNLNKNKKLIYWTPTNIDLKDENFINITSWMNRIKVLQHQFNIIIRPHPKTLMIKPQLINEMKNLNFFIDNDPNRNIGEMIKASDLHIADYGGTVFSAIYLNKPVLLLNLNSTSKFVNQLSDMNSLDIKLRQDILNVNMDDNDEKLFLRIKKTQEKKYRSIIRNLKKKYYGKITNKNLKYLKKFLLNLRQKSVYNINN